MRTMKIWSLAFAMLTAFSLASCRPSAQKAEAERQASSTEVSDSADTLRLVIRGEESAANNSVEPVRLKYLSDSIVILYSIENTTQWDYTYLSDEYWIERRVDGEWIRMPNDFGSTLMGKEIPPHSSVNDSAIVFLKAGRYRFCNTAYSDDARIDNEEKIMQAEFELRK